MSDVDRLLELIEEAVVDHGGDLGGWTRRVDGALQLFDGRTTLRAEVEGDGHPPTVKVHAHVFATLHEHDDEVLDACLFGLGEDHNQALAEAAMVWLLCVAGPIKSFLDGQPVCMTCQAGVDDGDATEGYVQGDYGLSGLRAYVGPSFARGFDDERVQSALDDTKPWFRFAAESAAPSRVHLAKATVSSGEDGWRRDLEIDGHEVSHHDPDFPAGLKGPDFGYLTRFAVFEFPRNSSEVHRRAELERTIRHFATHYSDFELVDDLKKEMVRQGFDPDLVHEVESVSTIAFSRMFFEQHGVQFSPTVIRARRDGRIETDVPLMSIPAYTRARVLAVQLLETMSEQDFQDLCFYNAEAQAILKAMKSYGDKLDLTRLTMFPCIVPDRDVSNETMDAALEMLNDLLNRKRAARKPWWKFW